MSTRTKEEATQLRKNENGNFDGFVLVRGTEVVNVREVVCRFALLLLCCYSVHISA